MPSTTAAKDTAVKHRACDECRSRKLACSKDPDGCERCKRERITCHYSEQKPMGRPRKRQFIETTAEDSTKDPTVESLDMGPLPFFNDDFDSYNDGAIAEPYYTNIQPTFALAPELIGHEAPVQTSDRHTTWQFGNQNILNGSHLHFGDIDFGPVDNSLLDNALSPVDQVPQLSTASNTSSSDSGHSPPPNALAPCSCLASMYLALSSLQTLPSDIVQALRTVRGAARTASTTIWCPQCGAVLLSNPKPPMEAFQNTMLLGTLLPILAFSYRKLLDMVDTETEIAVAAGQTKTFRFQEYGGLAGSQENITGMMACMEKEIMLGAVEMPPVQWRATVRALLRVDVYGHDQEGGGFSHKGLKDLVATIENRQKARHAWLNMLPDGKVSDKGAFGAFGAFGENQCLGEQTHGCLQILEMARLAIDNLIIA